jgi:chorismate--pyruvate lyase
MKTNWKKNLLAGYVPANLSAWLSHKGSFMRRLKKYGVKNAVIQVLTQSWLYPSQEERALLKIKPRQLVFVREVVITSPPAKWMFARTVLPRATLTGKERRLAHLKNRALGSVLFKDPHVRRGEFELACVRRGSAWYQKIVNTRAAEADAFWARRSVFLINHKPLLLTEIFFPDVAALKNGNA